MTASPGLAIGVHHDIVCGNSDHRPYIPDNRVEARVCLRKLEPTRHTHTL